jgi:hypothetical protein
VGYKLGARTKEWAMKVPHPAVLKASTAKSSNLTAYFNVRPFIGLPTGNGQRFSLSNAQEPV